MIITHMVVSVLLHKQFTLMILVGYTRCCFCFLFQIGQGKDLSEKILDGFENDEEYLKKVHHLLMEVSLGECI